jgi:outer membrane protein assembly factor BamB
VARSFTRPSLPFTRDKNAFAPGGFERCPHGEMLKAMKVSAAVIALCLAACSVEAQDWPAFRGAGATGVAETGAPPVSWDIGGKRNVAWTTAIPGLGHSSPIVWGNRVFLTSAVPSTTPSGAQRRTAGPARPERPAVNTEEYRALERQTRHAWRLYCLDRQTGRVLWERTAYEGIPRVKRHAKASQASATPATDGNRVVTMMGSEGLYAYDMEGRLLWKRDFGWLDVGYADDPTDEWGPASSPVIHNGLVIVQNDRHKDSYVAAFDVATGDERWRIGRDELPAWSTPVVHQGARPTLVTNSPNFIRGHDLSTGTEIWRIADGTQVKVVTPVVAGDLVIVTGGYPTGGRPIFAIRAATGDIAWQLERGSSYTPTPIVYRGVLYVCIDNGVLSAYDVGSGKRLYQQRIAPESGGFSASPVAADGRLYFPSEDGIVYVVRAGRTFDLLARNDMREMCLATPAVSGDLLLVRTRTHIYALRESRAAANLQ